MPANYYMILGIERGADPDQIKRAYRQAIKRYHPDKAGSATDSRQFRQAREAYEVLSDIDRRRAYDAQLNREGIPVPITNLREDAVRRRRAWRAMRDTASPLEAFFEGLFPGYRRPDQRRPSRNRDLYMEIVLTPEEARLGGTFPVAVPVVRPCPDCARGRYRERFDCPSCRGRGTVRSRREFGLEIPPQIPHGTTAMVSLGAIGLPDTRLSIDIRIRTNL